MILQGINGIVQSKSTIPASKLKQSKNTTGIKGIFHPKNENAVINYSPS